MRKVRQTSASRRSNVNSLDFSQTLGIECACAQNFCTETCFQEAYFFDWYNVFRSKHIFHGNRAFHINRFFHAMTNCNSSHEKCRENAVKNAVTNAVENDNKETNKVSMHNFSHGHFSRHFSQLELQFSRSEKYDFGAVKSGFPWKTRVPWKNCSLKKWHKREKER